MSLDKWFLPPAAIAELYKNVLVQAGTAEPASPDLSATSKPAFLGNNQKKITILVQQTGGGFISDEELEILLKILTACRLGMADVAIMNKAAGQLNWKTIREISAPAVCLLFGTSAAEIDLPVIFPEFHEHSFDGTVFLQSPGLAAIEADKLLKSKLWLCLKSIFRI